MFLIAAKYGFMEKAIDILKKFKGKRLGIGVSGGADSMCLLSLVLKIVQEEKERLSKNNPIPLKEDGIPAADLKKAAENIFFKSVTVLHVDHNLRASSKRDRDLVRGFCAMHGVEFKAVSVDVSALAAKSKQSIETAARQVRHGLYHDFISDGNGSGGDVCGFGDSKKEHSRDSVVALGHTLDDQAESVLMHIFRGCGLNGLRGMSEEDRHIIRPLIYVSKAEILEYVRQNKIPYNEDETNADTRYSRNLIRELLKNIKNHYPSAIQNISNLSRLSADALDVLSGQLNEEFYSADGDAVLLDKRALHGEKNELIFYYIIRACGKAGVVNDIELVHIEAVKNLKTGGRLDLPRGLKVYSERGHLAFVCVKPHMKERAYAEAVPFKKGLNTIGGVGFFAEEGFAPFKVSKGSLLVDADLIDGASVRFRQDGDKFKPYGGGTKKLKEFLNDKHIPNRKKDFIPLICKGDEVLAVAGIELSDNVKITEKTKRAYKITVCN